MRSGEGGGVDRKRPTHERHLSLHCGIRESSSNTASLATWKWRARIKPSVSPSMMTTAIAEWLLPDDDGGEERAEIHSEGSTHRRSFPPFFSSSASQLACVCRFLAVCLPVNLLVLEAWATGPTVFPESTRAKGSNRPVTAHSAPESGCAFFHILRKRALESRFCWNYFISKLNFLLKKLFSFQKWHVTPKIMPTLFFLAVQSRIPQL
jgi:hypothetical protein